MAQDTNSKVAAAKSALARAKAAGFPSMPKVAPVAIKAAPAPKPASGGGDPTVGASLKAKSDNVNEYLNSLPKMHKGGPVLADGAYQLKAGEHVLAKGEAAKATKHALMASGMKSLIQPGKASKVAAPKEKTSMSIEGANVVDKPSDGSAPKIPPAPRSPIPSDDAFHKSRVETI
jgi:hypothetical protein